MDLTDLFLELQDPEKGEGSYPTVSVSRVRIKTFGISSNTSIHKLGNVLLTYFSVALCE